jgi:hypothetical protein
MSETSTCLDDTFQRNLEALETSQPELAARLRQQPLEPDAQLFVVDGESDFSHRLNIAWQGAPLHALEDPHGEAKAIFEANVPEGARDHQTVIFQYGCGLGYLLQRSYVDSDAVLVVYEPYLPVLRQTLDVVDFSDLFRSSRVILATEFMDILTSIGESYIVGDRLFMLELPAYKELDPKGYLEVLTELRGVVVQSRINQNTHVARMEKFTRMSINNLPLFLQYPTPQFLHRQFEGQPGVIVSAGPSLDKPGVLEALREQQEHLIIAAVGQAARALDKAGIIPDFICQIECADVSHQLADVSYLDKTNLILLPQSHAKSYAAPAKRKLIAFPNQDPLTEWVAAGLEEDIFGYSHQGTVSISCLVLLRLLGCNPIYILGQDLAFPDGQMYAKDSIYRGAKLEVDSHGKRQIAWGEDVLATLRGCEGIYESEEQFQRRNRAIAQTLVEVKGWEGETLWAPADYAAYGKVFESIRMVTEEAIDLVNCSEGGRYLRGYRHQRFVEAMAEQNMSVYRPKEKLEALFEAHYREQPSDGPRFQRIASRYTRDKVGLLKIHELTVVNLEIAQKLQAELERKSVLTDSARSYLKQLIRRDDEIQALCAENTLINNYIRRELFCFVQEYGRKLRPVNDDVAKELQGDAEALKENNQAAILIYKSILKGIYGVLDTMAPVFEGEICASVQQVLDEAKCLVEAD